MKQQKFPSRRKYRLLKEEYAVNLNPFHVGVYLQPFFGVIGAL